MNGTPSAHSLGRIDHSLPTGVSLVALSATVAKNVAGQLTGTGFERVHGPPPGDE